MHFWMFHVVIVYIYIQFCTEFTALVTKKQLFLGFLMKYFVSLNVF